MLFCLSCLNKYIICAAFLKLNYRVKEFLRDFEFYKEIAKLKITVTKSEVFNNLLTTNGSWVDKFGVFVDNCIFISSSTKSMALKWELRFILFFSYFNIKMTTKDATFLHCVYCHNLLRNAIYQIYCHLLPIYYP